MVSGFKAPDNPAMSCCGEAHAYWADAFEATSDGQYIAIITDPREDGIAILEQGLLFRKTRSNGTKAIPLVTE
jgi:hypothetical protein